MVILMKINLYLAELLNRFASAGPDSDVLKSTFNKIDTDGNLIPVHLSIKKYELNNLITMVSKDKELLDKIQTYLKWTASEIDRGVIDSPGPPPYHSEIFSHVSPEDFPRFILFKSEVIAIVAYSATGNIPLALF